MRIQNFRKDKRPPQSPLLRLSRLWRDRRGGKGGVVVAYGFTLIELLLGVVITSIILLTVYTVFFAALDIRERSLRQEDTVGQMGIALEAMARDLENTVGYNFANSYPEIKAFNGAKDRITFLQSSPQGLRFVSYYLQKRDEGRRHDVQIGQHSKKNVSVTESKTGTEAVYDLIRESRPFLDYLTASDDHAETRIVCRNIKSNGLQFSFGSVNPDSGGRAWYASWSFNVIPALTKIELASGPNPSGPGVQLAKMVLNPAGTMIVE